MSGSARNLQAEAATRPQRIQRSRAKGYRLPPDAIYVGRPTKWGNRYKIGEAVEHVTGDTITVEDAYLAMVLYREWFMWQTINGYPPSLDELRGHDLACWCALVDKDGNPVPCHADVLLELANGAA